MTDRRTFLASVGAAGAMLLGGCGSSDPEPETISSGTRIRAPLVGLQASDLDIGDGEADVLATDVAAELDVGREDVRVRQASDTVEIFSENVGPAEVAGALQASGVDADPSDVDAGVTEQTRSTVLAVLGNRLDRMDLSGGRVETAEDGSLLVEIPNTPPERAREIVTNRGTVRIVAVVTDPETNERTTTTVLTNEDIAAVHEVGQRSSGGWEVPVTVTDEAAQRFQRQLNELGFTSSNGPGNCDRLDGSGPGSYCLQTKADGEVIRVNSLGTGLAQQLSEGGWADDARFTIGARNASEAERTKRNLDVGALPTTLDLDAPSAEVTQIGA